MFLLILTRFPFFQKHFGCNFKGIRPTTTHFITCSYIQLPFYITRYQSPLRHQRMQHITLRQSIDGSTVELQFCFLKHKLYIVTILECRAFIRFPLVFWLMVWHVQDRILAEMVWISPHITLFSGSIHNTAVCFQYFLYTAFFLNERDKF